MKMDKEALLKHKFWILLGVFGLFWIVALSILWFTGGSPAAEAKTNYDKAKGDVTKYSGASRPKNGSFLPPWNDYGTLFKNHKNQVWKEAWDGYPADPSGKPYWQGQKDMYIWPTTERPGDPGPHPLQTLLAYPDSAFDAPHREWFKGDDVYKRQFDYLYYQLKTVDPDKIDPNNAPPGKPLDGVAFKPDYYSVMKPVQWSATSATPSTEECWLAQEDFWVRREVLRVVVDALATAAHMDAVDAEFKDKPDAKYTGRRVFRNDSWEIGLLFDKDGDGKPRVSPDSWIKNVHVSHRDQDLDTARSPGGVWFRLRQQGISEEIAFTGERVAYGQSRTLGKSKYKEWPLTGLDPNGSLEMEQVFDSTNSPVTQIDAIAIPMVSHKQGDRPLLPTKPGTADKPDRYGSKAAGDKDKAGASPGGTTPGAGGTPGSGSTMGAGSSMSGMSSALMGKGGVGGMNNQSAEDLTGNKEFGIHKNRYLFVTDQSRHLPIGVTLTVDQAHLHEVLAAFANSRMRFQTTQVEFRRVPSAAPPPSSASPGGPPGGFPPPPGGTGPAAGSIGKFGPGSTPGPGGTPGPGSTNPGSPFNPGGFRPDSGTSPSGGQAVPEADNPNLVEVTIYGIASLYEHPRAEAPKPN